MSLMDPLLVGEKTPMSLSVSAPLKKELERAAALDGYGGSRQFSSYVAQLLIIALRQREAERKASGR